MKFCPQCGTSLEPDSRFCQECGCDIAAFEVTEPETQAEVVETSDHADVKSAPARSCPQCNSAMAEEERFCQECGFDTAGIQPVDAETIQPPQPALVTEVEKPVEIIEKEAVLTPELKQFCANCGVSMATGDVFCQECGFNNADEKPVVPEVLQPAPIVIKAEEVKPEEIIEKEAGSTTGFGQFCANCGAVLVAGDVFCQECGLKTEEPAGAGITPAPVVAPPPPPPAKSQAATPPPLPPVKQPAITKATASASQSSAPAPKKKKGVLFVLLGILALAVLGAGGWFAYDKFLKNPSVPAVDSTALTMQQELPLAEPEIADTTTMTEMSQVEPQKETPATAQTKSSTTKKTTPKKQVSEPKKYEPVKQEPTPNTEPVKVKVKPGGSKVGRTILSIYNDEEVKSGPLFASKLKLDKAFVITKITTYHHNWGKGAQPGTIALQKKKDTYGPWQARGIAGDDGTPNGKWVCEPNERLEEGTYKVELSDEKSWSYNGESGKKGFVVIEGYEAD